jgi:hypothetical protein
LNNTSPLPTYIGITHLAKHLHYRPYNVLQIIRKWCEDPEIPCPAPDALIVRADSTDMLWLKERLTEWEAWNSQRIAVSKMRAEEQRKLGKRTGRLPGPGQQPKA